MGLDPVCCLLWNPQGSRKASREQWQMEGGLGTKAKPSPLQPKKLRYHLLVYGAYSFLSFPCLQKHVPKCAAPSEPSYSVSLKFLGPQCHARMRMGEISSPPTETPASVILTLLAGNFKGGKASFLIKGNLYNQTSFYQLTQMPSFCLILPGVKGSKQCQ